jgi:hypothetical protein
LPIFFSAYLTRSGVRSRFLPFTWSCIAFPFRLARYC